MHARVSPAPEEEKPAEHVQVAAPPALVLLAGQDEQDDAAALLYDPAGQAGVRGGARRQHISARVWRQCSVKV